MTDTKILAAALEAYFAPWVLALGLTVDAVAQDSVTLRLPLGHALVREGGTLCGQAMLAAADTAMALAIINHFGQFRPCTTVTLTSSFLKPLSTQDALVQATVLRVGKSLAFGEMNVYGASDGKSVFRATATYALL